MEKHCKQFGIVAVRYDCGSKGMTIWIDTIVNIGISIATTEIKYTCC